MRKVFLDASILIAALDLPSVRSDLHLTWWGKEWIHCWLKLNYFPRRPRPDERGQLANLLAIPTVADLCADGSISLHTSDVAMIERGRSRISDTFDFFGTFLSSIDLLQTEEGKAARKVAVSTLRYPTVDDLALELSKKGGSRHAELVGILGSAHITDAFHIATIEAAGLDCFLTLDGKFVRHFQQMSRAHNSHVAVLSPLSLITELGRNSDTEARLFGIRDVSRQQRFVSMCRFRWPRSWIKRLQQGRIQYLPMDGNLYQPEWLTLRARLVEMELKHFIGLEGAR